MKERKMGSLKKKLIWWIGTGGLLLGVVAIVAFDRATSSWERAMARHSSLALPASNISKEELPAEIRAASQKQPALSGPFVHKNLAVYLIHGDDEIRGAKILTLEEALKSKAAVVRETSDVGQLTIENTSKDAFIFIHSGDIVRGGKQDRTIASSFLVPPNSDRLPVDSFCVESGRWAKRGGESVSKFSVSSKSLSSKKLKLSAKLERNQQEVWKAVSESQEKLSGRLGKNVRSAKSESSLQLALEDQDLAGEIEGFTSAIQEQVSGSLPEATGMAFAINGSFNSADQFGSSELFRKLWPKLLEAAATEAIGDQAEIGLSSEAPATQVVQAEIRAEGKGQQSQQKLPARNYVITRDGKRQAEFSTWAPGTKDGQPSSRRIHRSVLSKR